MTRFKVVSPFGKAISRVHPGRLNECGQATGGHQIIGQAANLTFESAWKLLQAEHSPIAQQLQPHLGSVAAYETRPGNNVGLLYSRELHMW